MLVKSDFTSNLAIIKLGSNSSTSLAIKNESFIVYPLVVIGYWLLVLPTCKWVYLLQTRLDEKLEFHHPKPCEFYQVHKEFFFFENALDVKERKLNVLKETWISQRKCYFELQLICT